MGRELCGECGWHAGHHNAGCSIGAEMARERLADAERRRARAEERQRAAQHRRSVAQLRREERDAREAERQADASEAWLGTDEQPVHLVRGERRRSSSGERRPIRRGEFVRAEGTSGTNMAAGICSALVPGLGQLLQGRALPGLAFLIASGVLWIFLAGWIVALLAAFEAAIWKPPIVYRR